MALGRVDGRATIHVTAEDDSSSLLSPSQLVRSPEVARLEVSVRRLDDVLDREDLLVPVLLKLDVQGFELEALTGAGELLRHIDEIFVELSFDILYAGQALAGDVQRFMEHAGFTLVDIRPSINKPDGTPLQADALFRNATKSASRRGDAGR
jgi:hypothetical protein